MSTVYEVVTERILASLEAGVIPWRKEWKTAGRSSGLPYNLKSGAAYRGVNILTLLCSPYDSTGWCTYKQAQELGYQVRKGEKSSPVVFWSFPTKQQLAIDPERKPFAKLYSVFNVEQLDGVPAQLPLDTPEFNAVAECEAVVDRFMMSASHPTLAHGGSRAFYRQITDHVQMPERHTFTSPEAYYATLFHEFAHSTGIKTRLHRPEFDGIGAFGDEPYSREELTAEFASAFLCAESGIANDERLTNSVAYIQHWIKVLKNDKRMAVEASQKAQRAADFILGRTFAKAEESEAVGE
jgi:antirestriction protein ArdC